jgi:DNA-binding winged helix-turn-helix (wHTH) protein
MHTSPSSLYTFGRFQLDARELTLSKDGRPLPLEPKVLGVLLALVEKCGQLVTKDELMNRVWPSTFVGENNLPVCIYKLRKILGKSRNRDAYIETVTGKGYRLVAAWSKTSGKGDAQTARARRTATQEVQTELRMTTGTSRAVTRALTTRSAAKRTVAVLPFKFIGPIGRDTHLSLGLADALITRLGNLRQMTVRPTSAVSNYNTDSDVVAAGRELRVDSVVYASVQKRGRRLRVTVQLVDAGDGNVLWGRTFYGECRRLFDLEDSISKGVANALARRLSRRERKAAGERTRSKRNGG